MTGEPIIMSLFPAIRRHLRPFLACCIVSVVGGLSYAELATPLYTASATIMIGDRQLRQQRMREREAAALFDAPLPDPVIVESQAGILRSEQLGLDVVRYLNLADDPDFVPPQSWRSRVWESWRNAIMGYIGPQVQQTNSPALTTADADRRRRLIALKVLQRNLDVSHVARTFLLRIEYTAPDPVRAAQITNAFTKIYLQQQSDLLLAAATEGRTALQRHVEELGKLSAEADLAVQKFRADSSFLSSTGPSASEPQTSEGTTRQFQSRVHLAQLEQIADSYRTLYHDFVSRYQEAMQHDSVSAAENYVISPANPPIDTSQPKKSLILAISILAGAFAGLTSAIVREKTDGSFRTRRQVREELDVDVLGMLPALPKAASAPIIRYPIDHLLSEFSAPLQATKVAADEALREHSPKIIGIVSLFPGEGKTTVTKNFASLLGLHGARTLLIDASVPNPTLGRSQLGEGARASKLVYRGLRCEPDSNFQSLPSLESVESPQIADEFSSQTAFMQGLSRALSVHRKGAFDYIVIDFPPIGPLVIARSAAPLVDRFLLVIEWGQTPRSALRLALAQQRAINDKLLGVILNKVDTKKLRNYESPQFGDYDYQQYWQYLQRFHARMNDSSETGNQRRAKQPSREPA
jgi:uncharacterized protein involved in exopolysaccharide biosynthesis/Mrp family chromosome partitioning ATPase